MLGLLGKCGISVMRTDVNEQLVLGVGYDGELCEFLRILLCGWLNFDFERHFVKEDDLGLSGKDCRMYVGDTVLCFIMALSWSLFDV